MNDSVQSFQFGSKAETLGALAPLLTRSYVLPVAVFTLARWQHEPRDVVTDIQNRFRDQKLIVRSSARSEDRADRSNAGAYESVPDVNAADRLSLERALDTVAASYDEPSPDDQILVQPYLQGARLAGVLFSRDLDTLAPYRVFNYDKTGATDTVTSGAGGQFETHIRFRGCALMPDDPELVPIHAAVDEIEQLAGTQIETELALDQDGRVCIFQVRPLVGTPPADAPDEKQLGDWLLKAEKKLEKLSRAHPHLLGRRTIFGVMPDWNPAEIIGVRPRALALSLYKELVTDSIWAYMRDNYGYRNLRSFPLLISILGVPYIDVRVSFNSFVPKSVPDDLAARLVDHYLDRLEANPESDDKVEFDIVFSCYYPGITDDLERLRDAGFAQHDIDTLASSLHSLTTRLLAPGGLVAQDLAKIHYLDEQRPRVHASGMSTVDKIYWLLEDCKRYGTLPFSGLARAGFIAVQFLRGLVAGGAISADQYQDFMANLETIPTRLGADIQGMLSGELTREQFLARYGHLRPGTYDIQSLRYDEDFEQYFPETSLGTTALEDHSSFDWGQSTLDAVQQVLDAEDLGVTPQELFAFVRMGIEGREYAKLVFSRSLSDALVLIEELGAQCQLSRDELVDLDISTVMRLYATLDAHDVRDLLLANMQSNSKAYRLTQCVKLPELILKPTDVYQFYGARYAPNFITVRKTTGDVVPERALFETELTDKVVCIPSADPGYDWIFARQIGALITQFGGANSHMAIRSAELGIPAVIGCGEANFDLWSKSERLEIDCANQSVRVIR
ncbi:MAG: PEP-utilizing enzyme [Pseudomonadota bacterium]